MKTRMFILWIVLVLIAVPLIAQSPDHGQSVSQNFHSTHHMILKLKISGTAIPLANPLAGLFPTLISYQGVGNVGGVSGQGLYLYKPLNVDPQTGKTDLVLLEGQGSCRLDFNGDVLYATVDPGKTGELQIIDPTTFTAVWQQTWTGKIVGGTGRFEGATGSFKKSCKGSMVLKNSQGSLANAVVSPWEGSFEITLD